jgi:hypothetical protein
MYGGSSQHAVNSGIAQDPNFWQYLRVFLFLWIVLFASGRAVLLTKFWSQHIHGVLSRNGSCLFHQKGYASPCVGHGLYLVAAYMCNKCRSSGMTG